MSVLVELPGAVNAHTHLHRGLAPPGMPAQEPEAASFEEMLGRVWWRLDRALTAETLRAAARYQVARALLAGTTTLFDHHESPSFIEGSLDVIAGACDELGARAVLCYGATERNLGPAEAARGLAECARFVTARPAGLVRGAVGLHASCTVSDATLRKAGDLARSLQVPVHVHLAAGASDPEDAPARGHRSPLARLLVLDALPSGSILANGVHMTADEVYTCEERGLWLVHSPRSNARNGVGHTSALAASALVALGTDGFPSDMTEEGAAFAYEAARHGVAELDPEGLAAAGRGLVAEIFGTAAIEGDRVRVLAEGTGRARVIEVDVGGRPVVRCGALVRSSLEDIEADARRAASRLWTRVKEMSWPP